MRSLIGKNHTETASVQRLHGIGLLIAIGLFLNALVGIVNLVSGNAVKASIAVPQAVILCDQNGKPLSISAGGLPVVLTSEGRPLSVFNNSVDPPILRVAPNKQ